MTKALGRVPMWEWSCEECGMRGLGASKQAALDEQGKHKSLHIELVLDWMVANGYVETKVEDGETYYRLTEKGLTLDTRTLNFEMERA